MVYPYGPGSATDGLVRIIGTEASKLLGRTIIHENKAGAGGQLGFDTMRRSAPDGYTLSMVTSGLVIWQPLMKPSLNIELGRDYVPVALGWNSPSVLIVHPSTPFRDLKSLFDHAKANPGKLKSASAGIGTAGHLVLEILRHKYGIDIVHVPYKGAAEANTAVLSGVVEMQFSDGSARGHIDAGSVRGLAVTSEEKWGVFPELPTVSSELPGFRIGTLVGFGVAAGTPAEIVNKLNAAFNKVMGEPTLRAKIEADGGVPFIGTSEEFAQRLKDDTDYFRPIIEEAGIRLE
jgi:tripartite-type tricarboxylate transporter receptor subunit TctC